MKTEVSLNLDIRNFADNPKHVVVTFNPDNNQTYAKVNMPDLACKIFYQVSFTSTIIQPLISIYASDDKKLSIMEIDRLTLVQVKHEIETACNTFNKAQDDIHLRSIFNATEHHKITRSRSFGNSEDALSDSSKSPRLDLLFMTESLSTSPFSALALDRAISGNSSTAQSPRLSNLHL